VAAADPRIAVGHVRGALLVRNRMKRMPAAGKMSSASMYAEPTMPKISVTPCDTSVSTKASDAVIFCLPWTTIRAASVALFI
jgi:hypothetical protein